MSDLSLRDLRALVVCMASLDEEKPLGQKALQKLLYILQSSYHISNGYKFNFYTYGVHSKDLAGDLDLLRSMDVLDIRYVKETRSYEVRRGLFAQEYINASSLKDAMHEGSIINFMHDFKKFMPWELEVISTAVFVEESEGGGFQELSQRVHELKPKFELEDIEGVLERTSQFGLNKRRFPAEGLI